MQKLGNKEFDKLQGMATARKQASRNTTPMTKMKKKQKMGAMGEGKPRMMGTY